MQRRFLLAAGGAVLLLAACGGGDDGAVSADPLASASGSRTIFQLAEASPDLDTLTDAVVVAGLQATLEGPGPFTVLAPTDAAFEALSAELGISLQALLADTALLGAVLRYHVIAGSVPSGQIPLGQPVTTVQGAIVKVESLAGQLTVTDGRNRTAEIDVADLQASNGIVHVIDRVLLPPNRDIVQLAQSRPEFSILVDAVVAANLQGTLSGTGPFTVFAPTNAAFAALLAELGLTQQQLLANTALLTEVLTYHVLPGRVLRAQIPVGAAVATVQGDTLVVGSDLAITDQRGRRANIVATDVFATNGVVHAIDRVILPSP
jgi:uncharacterized surface protein with fasciclin (FAS1) repeats